jgi:peptide/nickel transport system substrate-binding protein/oligopeptide transport system substrate-binding protein
MKRTLALLLAALLLFSLLGACAKSGVASDEVAAVDWSGYDSLIAQIKSTTDMAARVDLMHQAEDQLRSTSCIVPIYYYNDIFLQKDYVTGIYSNNYGFKYFMYADMTNGSKTLKLNLASEPAKLDPALNSSVDGACLAETASADFICITRPESLFPTLPKAIPFPTTA